MALLEANKNALPELFIVSEVTLERKAGEEIEIKVVPAAGEKCERCWNRSVSVGADSGHPTFCARCAAVVGSEGR